MRESGAFAPGTDLTQTLEFYFQGCSIEVDAQMLAVAAASLANAGVCPLTEDPVFSPGAVQSCLSLMSSCGMYDFSGEFAFTIGLPAKSGGLRRADAGGPGPDGHLHLVAAAG